MRLLPARPDAGQFEICYSRVIPEEVVSIYFKIVGTDDYSKEETQETSEDGMAMFTIHGGGEGVTDVITGR